ncbi:hypothetical protein [Pollutibacter soli]|uniref:hypothetical protein n=1 Tax=Pollutibacter soli TaxID=3034157 RepID=UPI003013D9E2
MNFEDFQLPASIIRNLYKDSLYDLNENSTQEKSADSLKNHTLGDNQQKILVLIKDKSVPVISDEDLAVLNRILAACKLSLRDISLSNIAEFETTGYEFIFNQFQPQTMLMLGVAPSEIDLPVNFPLYNIYQFSKIKMVAAPDLSTIEANKEIKKSLWTSLQKLFLS